jgi:hypothetical protein
LVIEIYLKFGFWDLGFTKTHFKKTKLRLETDFSDEIEELK